MLSSAQPAKQLEEHPESWEQEAKQLQEIVGFKISRFCFYPALLEEGAGGWEEQGLRCVSPVQGIDAEGGMWLCWAELGHSPGTAGSCQAQPFQGNALLLKITGPGAFFLFCSV